MEYLHNLDSTAKEDKLRAHLAAFGLAGRLAVQKIKTLSGGQKCRVVLSALSWKAPHILLLDEPTNHLDYPSIEGLISGLQAFSGGLVVISHDQYFLKSLNCSLWLASRRKKNIYPYPNTLEEYAERQASMIKRKKEKQN